MTQETSRLMSLENTVEELTKGKLLAEIKLTQTEDRERTWDSIAYRRSQDAATAANDEMLRHRRQIALDARLQSICQVVIAATLLALVLVEAYLIGWTSP